MKPEDKPDWFVEGAIVVVIADTCGHRHELGTVVVLGDSLYSMGRYYHKSDQAPRTWLSSKDVKPVEVKSLEELL